MIWPLLWITSSMSSDRSPRSPWNAFVSAWCSRSFTADMRENLRNIHMTDATTAKLTSMHFHGWERGLKTGMCHAWMLKGEVAWESPLRWWWWHKHSLITISSWENNHPFWQSLFYLFFKERSCFNDSRSSKSFNRLIIFQCEFANHAHQRKPNAILNKGMKTSWNHWDVCVCVWFLQLQLH